MTAAQKLEIRRSEIRERLGEIAALEGEDFTDEVRTEAETLQAELRDSETRLRCAIQSETGTETETETEEDAEARERRELRGKARVGAFLAAAIRGTPLSGAELEIRDAHGLRGDHEIPLELFEPLGSEVEERAVTPAPASGTEVVQRPTQPFIYREGVTGFLGIDMPTVEPGTASFPVVSTAPPAGAVAPAGAASETAAAFTISAATPKRVAGAVRINHEAVMTFPMMEEALRREMPLSLADAVEEQALNGDGNAPNLSGLFARLGDPTADTDVETLESFVKTFADTVEGRHAYDLRGVRALVGQQTWALMASVWRGDSTTMNAAAFLAEALGGLRLSARIAAPASDNQQGIVRLGMRPMSAVMPVFGGVEIIRDPYTAAGAGQVVLTATQLVGDVFLIRSDAFGQVDFHLA